MTQPADKITLDSLDALKVFFDPMRQKILQVIANQPRTVHEIADALDVPFTRLYYHIKMLERHQIVRVVDTVSMSGAIEEKYYQVAARNFVIARSLLAFTDEAAANNPGLEMLLHTVLDESGDQIRQAVRAGQINLNAESPDPDALLLRRGVFHLKPDDVRALHQDLLALLSRYHDRTTADTSDYISVVLAVFPVGLPDDGSEADGASGEG